MSRIYHDDITGRDIKLCDIVPDIYKIVDKLKTSPINDGKHDVLDFGICTGNGTYGTLHSFKEGGVKYRECFGFDSLEGLPAEEEGFHCPDNWKENAFSISNIRRCTKEESAEYLEKKLDGLNFNLIPGYFCDSLKSGLEKQLKPAIYVSIDVDLYISTKQALNFLCDNNLIVVGTVIRYDDWGDSSKGEESGESAAHSEMCNKYSIRFDDMYRTDCSKTVIRVD